VTAALLLLGYRVSPVHALARAARPSLPSGEAHMQRQLLTRWAARSGIGTASVA
jgi:hypothetical protein